ncbi:MAG: apolipoprotein N-acyltransferase [Gemmatimonadetes bacterium]|nr:apolipoprotein N-acyltransferase [Gemmatimonadota bacterium]
MNPATTLRRDGRGSATSGTGPEAAEQAPGRRASRFLPPRGERLLPLLSALLLVLSFPPFELLVPPFVALVPFLVFLADRPAGPEGRWSAARAGYWLGLVYFGLLLYWMLVALVYYSALAVPAYVLTVLILAGFLSALAAGLHYVRERTSAPLPLVVAALWTAFEWLQGHLADLSFPWLGLGTALSGFPRVAGAADLVGARGLTFWIALVNGLVALLVLRARARRPLAPLAAATAAAVLLPVAYGFWRAQTLELRPAARVAIIQPNIPEDLKLDRSRAVDSSLTALASLTARIPPGSVDLVIWPEVAVPALIEYPWEAGLQARLRELSAQAGAPVLVGAYGIGGPQEEPVFFNSAYLVSAAGIDGPPYHKQYLVPFVERVPFIDPERLERITGDLRYFGGLGRGWDSPALRVGQARFGVLICYESIFAPLSRRYRRRGADYLVNITNDAWYGREPWYARTSALWQHPAHLALRAIEERVGIARAANTGISLFVDPLGRTYERTRLFVPDARVGTVYTTDVLTLYARWGDWLATSATLAAVLLLVWARLTRRGGDADT